MQTKDGRTLSREDIIGNTFEAATLKKLQEKYPLAYKESGRWALWDLVVPGERGQGFTIECKADQLAHETGNIAVEIESWGKPSGLSITEATWQAFGCRDVVYFIRTDYLREAILENSYRKIFAGFKRASLIVLVPCEHLENDGEVWKYSYPSYKLRPNH